VFCRGEREETTDVVYTYTLCLKKNDNDVAHYNFNPHKPILIIFGTDVAE